MRRYYIYTQLPNQPEPKALWSTVLWKEVTSEYAGLFFRAEGSGSASFGELQNANVPSSYINSVSSGGSNSGHRQIKLPSEGWSNFVYSGSNTDSNDVNLRFHVSQNTVEVRPINKAVRIWKRIN